MNTFMTNENRDSLFVALQVPIWNKKSVGGPTMPLEQAQHDLLLDKMKKKRKISRLHSFAGGKRR